MADKKDKGSSGAVITMFAILGAIAAWSLISPEFLMCWYANKSTRNM